MFQTKEVTMSAQDNIDEAEAKGKALPGVAFVGLLFLACCGNSSRQVNQNKEPEKDPVKIEHRENPATNPVYKIKRSCLIHIR